MLFSISVVIQGFILNMFLRVETLYAFSAVFFIILVYDSIVLSEEVRLSIFCHCTFFISDLKVLLLNDLYKSDSFTDFLLLFFEILLGIIWINEGKWSVIVDSNMSI